MRETACANEEQILEALGKSGTIQDLEEPLRQHVEKCASCSELISVYEWFQKDSEQLRTAAPVPEAGLVWWRAMLAARRAAAERALRPILIAEKAALAVGGGILIALLLFVIPRLSEQLAKPNVLSSTAVYNVPLTSLIVTSVIVCVLVMAGALFALWAEK